MRLYLIEDSILPPGEKSGLEFQCYSDLTGLIQVAGLRESQCPTQFKHGAIVVQYIAVNRLDAAPACVTDDAPHQHHAQAHAGHVVVYNDSVFRPLVVRVGDDANQVVDGGVTGDAGFGQDQRHLAVVVDLGKTGGHHMGEGTHAHKETQADFFGGERREGCLQCRFVGIKISEVDYPKLSSLDGCLCYLESKVKK